MNENQELMSKIHNYFGIGEKVLLSIGLAILIIYWLRLVTIRNSKKRYDYINTYEIKALKYSTFFIVITLILLLDELLSFQFEKNPWSMQYGFLQYAPFIGGFFVILIIGILVFTGIRSFLNVYYPKYLGRRLDKIRYSPRISSKTGNEMKLLNEDEEDVYLTEQMQMDEESLRYDYDVWLDEQSGDVKIEKYDVHQNAVICPECKYRTLRSYSDELVSTIEGEEVLQRDYECNYCGYRESKQFKVSHVDNVEHA